MRPNADRARLNEAEIQLLASQHALVPEDRPVTPRGVLEQGGEDYWIYREDRTRA